MAAEASSTVRVQVKICGLTRPEDARLAGEAGAAYLGVVFASGPRRRSPEQARKIWSGAQGRRVGVFSEAPQATLLEVASGLDLAVVQLHGLEAPEFCAAVRRAGDWEVWKAIRVESSNGLLASLERYASSVDGLLLEGPSERGRGGVGARFDWSQLEEVRTAWPRPLKLILAGGLNTGNVGEAIEVGRPDVVDVSSGVERAPGIKDGAAIRSFVRAAQRAPEVSG